MFFPEGYDLKETSVKGEGSFFIPSKIKPGETVSVRCIGEALTGYLYWNDKKECIRSRVLPENPPDIKRGSDGKPERIRHFWAFPIWNATAKQVQIAEVTQKSIQDSFWLYHNDPDWGNVTTYNVKITREGEGLDTEYKVTPVPKSDLPQEAIDAWQSMTINLEALLTGDNPFESGTSSATDMKEIIRKLFAVAKSTDPRLLDERGQAIGVLDSKDKLRSLMGVESISAMTVENLLEWVTYFEQVQAQAAQQVQEVNYDEIPF